MSGIPYHIGKSLAAEAGKVDVLSPLDSAASAILARSSGLAARLPGLAGYDVASSPALCKLRAHKASLAITRGNYDLVICVYAHALTAYLKADCPIVYVSDSTYRLNLKYYEYAKQQTARSQSNNDKLEQLAISNANFLIYPSSWAAESALLDYGADPAKIYEVPFGANIDPVPDADGCHARHLTGPCRLLYIGRDWARKGGSLAVETLHLLREAGVDARLTICGCDPPDVRSGSVTVIPSISRKKPDEVAMLNGLFSEAHFLLLPTRAEAFGIVFAEASAFALPSITTDTGGVCGAVENGVNGYRLPLSASAEEYANLILGLWGDPEQYARLMRSTRARYEDSLNWSVWAQTLMNIVTGSADARRFTHSRIESAGAAQCRV